MTVIFALSELSESAINGLFFYGIFGPIIAYIAWHIK